jgi:hypothetical protein
VPADDLRSLISDKENLRNLSKKKASLDIGIAANKSALLYLKQRTINLFSTSQYLQGMDSAIAAWNSVNAERKNRFKIEAQKSS